MAQAKIAISLDRELLKRLDRLVAAAGYPSRSNAVQEALKEKLARLDRHRFARECAKLDPAVEKAFAEEGLGAELSEWPEY